MRDTLKKMRVLYLVLMVCMFLYIRAMTLIPASYSSLRPELFLSYIFIGASALGVGQMMRYLPRRFTIEKLRANPDDPAALRRWRSGLVVSAMTAESVILFGFAIHVLGGTSRQVAPFFIAGTVALLIWWPRQP